MEARLEQFIHDLVRRYDEGALSRREFVGALAMLSAASGPVLAQPSGFESARINHVSITCSDLDRTVAFYRRAFALPLVRANPPQADLVQLGVGRAQHLSIRKGSPAGVDHFAIVIDNFNMDRVVADLKARGAMPETGGGAGLHVRDPDGINVQLIANAAGG